MKVSYFRFPRRFLVGVILSAAGCSTAPAVVTPRNDASTDAPTDASTGPVCPTVADDMISSFTTDNGVNGDGKMGGWYTYGDISGRGTLTPAEGGGVIPDLTMGNTSCSNVGSLHVTATGFVDWGAATGTDFMPKVQNDGGAVGKGTYDASRYRGVSFWAKSAAPVRFVQVSFKDPYSDLPSVLPDRASHCVFDSTMPTRNCSPFLVKFGYGYVGSDPSVATDYPAYVNYKIDETWKRFEVLFADTKQDRNNPGIKPPGGALDLAHLTGMSIQVNSDHATTPPTANDFEIWIDDVTFIR
jgi:hypothetical protein